MKVARRYFESSGVSMSAAIDLDYPNGFSIQTTVSGPIPWRNRFKFSKSAGCCAKRKVQPLQNFILLLIGFFKGVVWHVGDTRRATTPHMAFSPERPEKPRIRRDWGTIRMGFCHD